MSTLEAYILETAWATDLGLVPMEKSCFALIFAPIKLDWQYLNLPNYLSK